VTGPGDETAAAAGCGDLRASHADREQVIGALKAAFVQGRLTGDELDARAGQVYASRTYAELDEVTADIPTGLSWAKPARDPWRATKTAGRIVYAVFAPGLVALVLLPGGRVTAPEVIILTAVVYLLFWILGVSVMVASRPKKRSAGSLPPRSVPGADGQGAAAS
jgi:Domain of unknown function (DUF1707)